VVPGGVGCPGLHPRRGAIVLFARRRTPWNGVRPRAICTVRGAPHVEGASPVARLHRGGFSIARAAEARVWSGQPSTRKSADPRWIRVVTERLAPEGTLFTAMPTIPGRHPPHRHAPGTWTTPPEPRHDRRRQARVAGRGAGRASPRRNVAVTASWPADDSPQTEKGLRSSADPSAPAAWRDTLLGAPASHHADRIVAALSDRRRETLRQEP
jgi:hypothetical protein